MKPERAHYFDVGVVQDVILGLKVGVDAYYKYAHDLIDESQFAAPVILTPFNYRVGSTRASRSLPPIKRALLLLRQSRAGAAESRADRLSAIHLHAGGPRVRRKRPSQHRS